MNTLFKALCAGLLCLSLHVSFAQAPSIGLISYWPLDSSDGTTTADLSTIGNSLYLSNAPAVVTGQRGNAFSFNGTSQLLGLKHAIPDNDARGLPICTSPNGYTVMMWVKGAAQTAKYLFTEGNTTNTNPLLVLQTGNVAGNNAKLDVIIRTTAGTTPLNHIVSTKVVFDGTWHHIAWVDERGKAQLYVDGALDPTDFAYPPSLGSAFLFDTLSLGALVRSTTSGYFSGSIDEAAIWDRPLTLAEVQQVMTNGLALPLPAQALAVYRPPASTTNALGDRVAMSIGASGGHPTPLTYQWYQEGSPLADQTGSQLVLTNLVAPGATRYSIVVTRDTASVSNSAWLQVLPDAALDLTALGNSVISYWPFDELIETPPTTNSADIYYTHTTMGLTNMDSTSLVGGQVGNALLFQSTLSQYGRRIGGTPVYSSTNYTVSFWVNGGGGQANKQIFAEGGTNSSGANGDYFLLGTENPAGGGLLNIKSSQGRLLADKKSTQVALDNSWHHIAWVDQGGKAKLYVDGVVDATDFTYYRSNLVLTATAVGALFRASAANYFFGLVDELALWNRALNWSELQYIRTNGMPLPAVRVPPQITQHPAGSTNHLGDRVTLTVSATGSSPLSFQWLKDRTPMADQTNTSLTLFFTAAATNDYSVLVTNIAGSITSDQARVMVVPDPAADLHARLDHYWPMNTVADTPSPTSPDLYSHADLALNAMDSSSLVSGRYGNALSFNGSQYGTRSGGFPIYLTTNYTISFWVNGSYEGQSDARVFAEGSTLSGTPLFTIGTDNAAASASLDLYLRADGGTTLLSHRKSTRPVFDGTWHHVVWIDENGKARLYVDGVLDETDFSYTRGSLALETTAIGALQRAAVGNYFVGSIDEVVLWSRALSWTELDQVKSGTIPPAGASVAPSIFAEPADCFLYKFCSGSARLSVLASGTGPLSYQWRENGADIPRGTNPSAASNVLSVSAAMLPTGSAGYSVVITNAAGAVTSRVAQVVLSDAAFLLDFGLNNSPNAQPGFNEETLATSGSIFGGIRASVSALGGISLSDRNRTSGSMVTNSPPGLTQAQIYNDFIFGYNNATVDAGLTLLLENLAPNTPFGLTLWSFDPQSSGNRTSTWFEVSSGTPVPIVTNYYFSGSILPTADYDYTFGALLTSSAEGTLQIQGIKSTSDTSYAVFLNAVRLVPNPVIRVLNAQVVNGTLRMTVECQYPGQPIAFEERADLGSGLWTPSTSGSIVETHGPIVIAAFPLGTGSVFYRAVSTSP